MAGKRTNRTGNVRYPTLILGGNQVLIIQPVPAQATQELRPR